MKVSRGQVVATPAASAAYGSHSRAHTGLKQVRRVPQPERFQFISQQGQAMAIDTDEGVTFAAGPRPLVSYPGKRPLILVHSRPPHLETPFTVFNEGPITPNDAFFVRYHLADFPHTIEPNTYRLLIKGAVSKELSLSLDELKTMPG
jgi:DMSO/TMAO reductase YedYZ molybdopterin-dependent catalytic subunit